MRTLIRDCHVVSPGVELPGASVEIRDGLIAAVFPVGAALPAADLVVNAGGQRLLPGFVDIHTHGCAGHDVSDANEAGLRRIAEMKLREGVTTLLPTTLTLPQDRLRDIAANAARYRAKQEFAKTPGLHVEGPFINPKCAGAQNPAFVRDPNLAELAELHRICPATVVSMAPEMPGGVEFVKGARALGITVSCAHTAATYGQLKAAMEAGLTHLTHFCNQMSPLHHREIGCVGGGLLEERLSLELIADRIHLSADLVALVFKLKGPSGVMLITDSMSAAWQPDGRYEIGGLPVVVKEDAARLENGALAGSTLRYNVGLRNVFRITGRPLSELVATTSWNQARSLGWKDVGKVEAGFRADLVLLDEAFQPAQVWVDGAAKL